ncbi:MAG: phosphodiester glycosidase family protein [Clostridiales bacterium]|nr:phosphodiester glycosidase family protein [Clostridiales bacterium]
MKKLLIAMGSVYLMLMVMISASLAQDGPKLIDLRSLAPQGTFTQAQEEPIFGELSYQSHNISIRIEKSRVDKSDVYVADIYVSSVEQLKRAFSHGKWSANAQKSSVLVNDNNAILAITGDYSSLFDKGLVVANGEIIRKSANSLRHNCLIYKDGRMETFGRNEMDIDQIPQNNIWQSFLFGPELLQDDGQYFEEFNSKIGVANPRSVIGYYAPGHYCFVVVDGRGNGNKGMSMTQLSRFMSQLGCQQAYNLDGGQSAVMIFNGSIVNSPYKGGRSLNDIVYIGE